MISLCLVRILTHFEAHLTHAPGAMSPQRSPSLRAAPLRTRTCRRSVRAASSNDGNPAPFSPQQGGYDKKVTQSILESGIRGTVAVVLANAAQLDLFSMFHWSDTDQIVQAVEWAIPVMLLDAALLLPSYGLWSKQLAGSSQQQQQQRQRQQQQQQPEQQQEQHQQAAGEKKEGELWVPVQSLSTWMSLQAVSAALHEHQQFARRWGPKASAVQCSAVQCSAVQCSAVQCSAVQCSAVQCSADDASCATFHTTPCQPPGPPHRPAYAAKLLPPWQHPTCMACSLPTHPHTHTHAYQPTRPACRYSLAGLPFMPTQAGLEVLAQASEELLARGALLTLTAGEAADAAAAGDMMLHAAAAAAKAGDGGCMSTYCWSCQQAALQRVPAVTCCHWPHYERRAAL
jgi:hypothetical protein